MAIFRFKLQSVLSIKGKIEEQKKIELGNAMIFLNTQIEFLNQLIEKQNGLVAIFNEKNGKRILAKELIELSASIKYYDEARLDQQKVIKKAEEMVEEKRVALNVALMERKTYEKLKEIALENYMKEEQADSFRQLDEIVSYKYSTS